MEGIHNLFTPAPVGPSKGIAAEFPAGNAIFQLPILDIIANTKAGIYITNEDDKVIWLNDAILDNPNALPLKKAFIGKPVLETMSYFQEFVIHPKQFSRRIKELVSSRKLFLGEEFTLKDNRTITLDFVPVFHEGKFYGTIWQVVSKPVKEGGVRNSEGNNKYSRSEILDNFNIFYCEISKNTDILECSDSLCSLTGYSEEELTRMNFMDICSSGKRLIKDYFKETGRSAPNKPTSFEIELRLKDGSSNWMQCHFSKNNLKKRTDAGGLLLLTEITEQKAIQNELEIARKHAEHAQLAQQQFLASMSHDIRTPLNAIIGMTFLLADTTLSREQNEYINILKNASNILLGLLNGVLDFAKIETGKQEVHPRDFDLPSLVYSLIETFNLKVTEKPVKITCSVDNRIDHYLTGDDVLLNQILMNLLNNAEKFTPQGEIILKATVVKEFDNNVWVEFMVTDTGIGISKNKLQDIFKDFIQADENIHLEYGGSGLGLFICKKLVELLGGQIKVESTLGKGTSFVFIIPFTKNMQALRKDKYKIPAGYDFHDKNATILIVEDNPMNLKYLSTLLNKYQVNFDIATNGKTGLKMVKENYYNLILMDMKLPKMNGIELTACIREKEGPNVATPVVLVTASALQSTVDKAKEIGVNEMLTKPYTPEQLMNVLKKYLLDDEEMESVPPSEPSTGEFRFDPVLDTSYLYKLYHGNSQYALSLFEVFQESMETDWRQLLLAKANEDWVTLKNLTHKLKPNFSMVGLTWVTGLMQEAYNFLKEGSNEKAVSVLNEVQIELDRYMPLIKTELKRMQEFNSQLVS